MRRQVAICIGIDDYDDPEINRLHCAWADAQAFAFALRERGFDDVGLLPGKVSLVGVESRLDRIGQQLRPGDLFVFYFAGHGHTITGYNGQPDQLFLLPTAKAAQVSSGNLFGTTGLLNWQTLKLTTDQWAGVERLFIFDACRAPLLRAESAHRGAASAACFQGEVVFRDPGPRRSHWSGQPAPATAHAVLNSCRDGQQAEELTRYPGSTGHGKFTAALLEELRENPRTATDEAFVSRLHQRMRRLGKAFGSGEGEQQPMLEGEVILLERRDESPPPPSAGTADQGPTLVDLIETFDRQLSRSQLWQPLSDCCVTTLAAMESLVLRTGQGSAMFEACKARFGCVMPQTKPTSPMEPVAQVTPHQGSAPPLVPEPKPAPSAAPNVESPNATLHDRKWTPAHLVTIGVFVALLAAFFGVLEYSDWKQMESRLALEEVPSPGRATGAPQLVALDERAIAAAADSASAAASAASRSKPAWAEALVRRMEPVLQVPGCSACGEVSVVPAGEFDMGSPGDEKHRFETEGPMRKGVKVASFEIGRTEVTQGQWKAVMGGGNPSGFKDCGDACPVENVSWNMIAGPGGFLEKLESLTGKKYRLPTEVEWEFACRAGTRTAFWFGTWDDSNRLMDKANYHWNYTKGATPPRPMRADAFEANPWGLYNIHGNVWEWVQDGWHDSYTGASLDGRDWVEGADLSQRVVRGGSWNDQGKNLRAAGRSRYSPGWANNDIGFRLARTL